MAIMKNRTSTAAGGESRLMDTEELRAYTNLGRNNAMNSARRLVQRSRLDAGYYGTV